MRTLRIPNRSVVPADFHGGPGFCQNLDCRAPLEPPYQSSRLCLPGGTLETVLCAACLPQPWAGTCPEMRLEVMAAAPVLGWPDRPDALSASGFIHFRLSELPPSTQPPPPVWPAGKPLPTFEELAEWEPRLLDLLAEARAHHKNSEPVFCANAVWYGYPGFQPGFKERMCLLVGSQAEQDGDLRTSAAYDVAYETIYEALPDCRGRCRCSAISDALRGPR